MGWKGWAGWLVYGLETELAVVGERDKHSKPLYLRDNLAKTSSLVYAAKLASPKHCVSVSKHQRCPYINLLMMGCQKLFFF